MAEQRFHTEITASSAQFDAEMESLAAKFISEGQAMQSAWRENFSQMQSNLQQFGKTGTSAFSGIQSSLSTVRGAFAALGLTLSAGMFVNSIRSVINTAGELGKLSQKVGIAVEDLSGLKYAAELSDVSTEQLTTGLKKLATSMFEASAGSKEAKSLFSGLRVEFESTPGVLRPTDAVLMDIADRFAKMADGAGKSALAVKLFGRDGLALVPLLNQGKAGIQQLKEELDRLGGTMSGAMAQQSERFNDQLKSIGVAASGLKIELANQMLPALTEITMAMREAAKEGGLLLALFVGLGGVAKHAFSASDATQLARVQQQIAGIQQQMRNVENAAPGFRDGREKRLQGLQKELNDLISKEAELANRIELAKEDAPRKKPPPPDSPNPGSFGNKSESRVSGWEAQLAAQRDAHEKEMFEQGSFQEFTKEKERSFWKAILDIGGLSKEEAAAVSKKYYAVEREIRKAAFDTEIAGIKAQIELHKRGSDERIAIMERISTKTRERFGADSKEAKQAEAEVLQASRENAERAIRLIGMDIDARRNGNMQRVELERANLDMLESLSIINGLQKVEMLRELKRAEFAIELQAAESRAQLLSNDVEAYRQAMEKIADLRRKNEVDMKVIDNREVEERKKVIGKWVDPIGQAVQTMVNGMLQGTQRMSDIIRNVLRNIAAQYASTLVQVGLDWVKAEILKTWATLTGVKTRTAAEKAGAAATTSTNAETATTSIGAKAWEAAAGVYASIAQIPYVGPFLAPAMAIAAAATVLGFVGKIASASGGFDIPSGINPVTQLHEQEMVLPAHIANPLRGMLAAGGGFGGAAPTINVYAMDSKDVRRSLQSGGALRKELHRVYRTNGILN